MQNTAKKINISMNTMWEFTAPKDYSGYRTFIFGIKAQSMFPEGVLYKGVSDTPRFYRGESGANSSLIPAMGISYNN